MPINVFGSSSNNSENKSDTSLFVQKPYLRTNCRDAKIEEDIGLKKKYRKKNLPDLISIREACIKNNVDYIFKNDFDFTDVKYENIKFVKVNCQLAVNELLTPKMYVGNAIEETSLVRNNQDNDLDNDNLTKINSIMLNTPAVNCNQVITNSYVDQFHQRNKRSGRDLGIDFFKSNQVIW